MSALLWRYYFENDLDRLQHVLANATFGVAPPSRGVHGGKGRHTGAVTIAGSNLATPPTVSSKNRSSSGLGHRSLSAGTTNSKTAVSRNLTRADLNWKDVEGITLLHYIASSNDADVASNFGIALLEAPSLDLYAQDAESGWTALHRALYTGNINLARLLINRDVQDSITPSSANAAHAVSGLIKVKDREGNSPFDVYSLSIANRNIRQASNIPLLSGSSDDEENEAAHAISGDEDDDLVVREIRPRINVDGDEMFTFGSNKNLNLGFGDEDDRKHPERIALKRPDHLLQRFHSEFLSRKGAADKSPSSAGLPAFIQHRPIKIQDVQLSKFHSAVLTTDPEANLHICGFGPGGRLGTGDETTRFQFVCIHGGGLLGKRIVHAALGQNHTIAISSQSEVFTWGSNLYGQLGFSFSSSQLLEEEPIQLLPRQIFGSIKRENIIGAAASRVHSVLHTPTSLYTFGKNDGQLGLVDSDARSLVQQTTPRKVAASLFTSSISAVSAIERATVCLLENHEVWIFANYGYTKVSFPSESFSDYLVKRSVSTKRHHKQENHICKIASGGDTICALSSTGNVFTLYVSQPNTAVTSSTTNPPKIRGALSAPQKVWSLRKDHMAVRDVAVGQDGSIIICTEAGSVWTRVERGKAKATQVPGSVEYKSKDYKFSRVGGLTRVIAVRSNAFGAYAAVRKDCDVLKTQIEIESKSLWKDLYPLLPFRNLREDENSDAEEPAPRFWIPSLPTSDTATIRRAVLTASDLEQKLTALLNDEKASKRSTYDMGIKSTTSDVIFPVHQFIVAGRSEMLRRGLETTRQNYYFGIPEVMTIEYDHEGRFLISFHGVDHITMLNLVLYMYTDVVVDVWRHTRGSPQLALRYRQIRLELMRLAAQLHMPDLEQAVRMMTEPPKTMDQDLERAFRNPDFFSTGDLEIELEGASAKVHSSLMCRRCPFFDGLFNGRASGLWMASRREEVRASQEEALKVDLKHVSPSIFRLVLRYLYTDIDDRLFDNISTDDFDSFLDVIMDVMSLANELMVDRLQQSCQVLLGRFVNMRNVCQLLNAVAPCSWTGFKDAALEYICLNLEGMMENHLLDELDDDLMVELDQVVRQNQLACSPHSRSRKAEEELFATYPELPAVIDENRRMKIEGMNFHPGHHDDDTHIGGLSKTGDAVSNATLQTPGTYQSRAKERKSRMKDSSSGSRLSSSNLMFEMDEGLEVGNESHEASKIVSARQEHSSRVVRQAFSSDEFERNALSSSENSPFLEGTSAPAISGSQELVTGRVPSRNFDTEPTDRQPSSFSEKLAWNFPAASSKLDMKAIMAQASLNRSSNTSSSLLLSQTPKVEGGSPARLSQRERKKRHQQQQLSEVRQPSPDNSPVVAPTPSETTPVSPWQMTSPGTKISLQQVIETDSQGVSPSSNRRKSSRVSSNPSLTLRQTVSGNSPSLQKSFGVIDESQGSASLLRPNSLLPGSDSRPVSTSHSSRSVSYPSTVPSSTPSNPVQSIRHQPSSAAAMAAAEPSLQLSMADILALQQTEKDFRKELVATKRSLQEIQEEQAFQEWWDQESRKVMEKEEDKKIQSGDAGGGEQGGGSRRNSRSGRGKGRDRGRDGRSGARGERGRSGRGGSQGDGKRNMGIE